MLLWLVSAINNFRLRLKIRTIMGFLCEKFSLRIILIDINEAEQIQVLCWHQLDSPTNFVGQKIEISTQ